jgi:hypothetical protein
MYEHVDELAPALLKSLSDTSDKVVKLDLEVLAELSSADEGESEERQEQADLFFKRCVKAYGEKWERPRVSTNSPGCVSLVYTPQLYVGPRLHV